MKLWMILLAVVLIKLILNLANASYLRSRRKLYLDWLADDDSKSLIKLRESKSRTIHLLKQAGIANRSIPLAQPAGLGMVANMTIGIFDQYPTRSNIFTPAIIEAFDEAIGTYKGRAIDAVNPLYWLSLIVYWPTRVCAALGAKQNSLFPKILQGVYWILGITASAAFALAKPHVIAWLKRLLDNIPA